MMIINILCAIASVVFCVVAPNGYDATFVHTVVGVFLVQNVLYLCCNGRSNKLGFEFFFFVAFFFVNFSYPIFYYESDPNYGFFWMKWNRLVISRATAIAYMGYAFYMLGLTKWFRMQRTEPTTSMIHINRNQYLCFFGIMVVSFACYMVFGGWQAMRDVYAGSGNIKDVGIYSYFNVIFALSAYLVAMFVFRLPRSSWWFYLLTIGICLILVLSTGSRSMSLAIVLILLIGWNNNVRRFRLGEIAAITLLGVLSLFLIVELRGADDWLNQLRHLQVKRLPDIFFDLTINGRNLYVLVDYGEHHAFTHLHGMLIDIATPIPGMAKHIVEWTGEPYEMLCAQDLTTYLYMGPNASWGLGCNMIGDAFRSFGYAGVAVSMFCIGWAVKETYYASSQNVYAYTIYYLLVSYSVFYTRAPILFPMRVLLWTLLIVWVVYTLTMHWDEVHRLYRDLIGTRLLKRKK